MCLCGATEKTYFLVSAHSHSCCATTGLWGHCSGAPGLGLAVLGLDGGEIKLVARAAVHDLPEAQILVHVPGEEPDPRLDVVVQLERDVLALGNLAAGVCDLVLWLLVFDPQDSPGGDVRPLKSEEGEAVSPAGVNLLARGASLELLHGNGPNVLEVVGARVGDDGVPDDGRVGRVSAGGRGPVSRDVDKDLLGVPREERGQVGIEGEFDDGVLLLPGAVVMRAALDAASSPSASAGGGRGGGPRQRGGHATLGCFAGRWCRWASGRRTGRWRR